MTRRRALLAVAVALAIGVAVGPFLASGLWVRARIEALPGLAREAGLPVRIEGLEYAGGALRARFSARLAAPGPDGELAWPVQGRVEHRWLAARIHTRLGVDGGDAAVAITDVGVSPRAPGGWSARTRLDVPAIDAALPGAEATIAAAPSRFELDADAARVAIDGRADRIAVARGALRAGEWTGVTVRLETAGPGALSARLAAGAGTVRAGALALGVERLAIDARIGIESGAVTPRVEIAATSIESRGVPYVRLDGPRAVIDGRIARAPGGGADADLRAVLRSASNYGAIDAEATRRGGAGAAAAPVAFALRLPASLARLLLGPRPELADAWRRHGILVERGPRATVAGRWTADGLAPPAP